MNLEITKINILPIDGIKNCVAIVQLELNECIRLTGIKLFYNEKRDQYHVEYPVNLSNKNRRPYYYPSNPETTEMFNDVIIKAYREQMDFED